MTLKTFIEGDEISKITATLEKEGYAIIKNLMSPRQLDSIKDELQPHIDKRVGTSDENGNFLGEKTRRVGGLLARSQTVQELVAHPLMLKIADDVLLPHCVRYRINYTGTMYMEPGETAQPLHRDTGFYPIQNPAPPLLLATMWALSDFSEQNGATRLVPGSRHWKDEKRPAPTDVIAAEMPAGSVLLYIGSTLHGGGTNRSDSARYGLALHYALGWLRQEENQYLAVPPEVAKNLPAKIQELLGYALGTSALGFVDHQDPNEFLNGTAGDQTGDFYSGLTEADNALRRFKISETTAVGRHYFKVD